MKLAELRQKLDEEGYEEGYPNPSVKKQDRETAERMDCSNCHFRTQYILGFMKSGSYRVYACCPKCDHTEEF